MLLIIVAIVLKSTENTLWSSADTLHERQKMETTLVCAVLLTQTLTDVSCNVSKLHCFPVQLETEHHFSELIAQPQSTVNAVALHCDWQSTVLHAMNIKIQPFNYDNYSVELLLVCTNFGESTVISS